MEFDQADPGRSSVRVEIPLQTLSTGVPGLDEDFRSTDFFAVDQIPTAVFKSTRVKGKGMGQLKAQAAEEAAKTAAKK